MKKILYLILIFMCFILFNTNIKADNVHCHYQRKEGSCGDWSDMDWVENGNDLIITINIDGKAPEGCIKNSISCDWVDYIDGVGISVGNNTTALDWLKEGDTNISAVDYYKKNHLSCPPYFVMLDSSSNYYDGVFSNTSEVSDNYRHCVFPLTQLEYNDDLELDEEIYSCVLYSTDPLYVEKNFPVTINYTKKTFTISGEPTDLDDDWDDIFADYRNSFDYNTKNTCPVGEFKICDTYFLHEYVFPISYNDDNAIYDCAILDSSEKADVGNSFCGIFIDFIKRIDGKTTGIDYYKLRNFCRTSVENDDYESNKYSCINMCLNIFDHIEGFESNGDCGFSDRFISFIYNIVKWLKYIIPVIVIVFGILDFIKAMSSEKDDEMKKAQGRFVKRLISAALIFLVPFIIEFILDKMGFEVTGCGIIKELQ